MRLLIYLIFVILIANNNSQVAGRRIGPKIRLFNKSENYQFISKRKCFKLSPLENKFWFSQTAKENNSREENLENINTTDNSINASQRSVFDARETSTNGSRVIFTLKDQSSSAIPPKENDDYKYFAKYKCYAVSNVRRLKKYSKK